MHAGKNFSFLEGRSSLDGKDILGDFFENITRDGFKQNKGQFFTPTTPPGATHVRNVGATARLRWIGVDSRRGVGVCQ